MAHQLSRKALVPLVGLAASLLATTALAQAGPSPTASTPATTGAAPGSSADDRDGQGRAVVSAPWQSTAFRSLLSPGLETFESDNDFRRYVARTDAARRRWERRFGAITPPPALHPGVFALQDTVPECGPDDPACPDDGPMEIVVTAQMQTAPAQSVATAITSITNNQSANVDEGDIVKQIGNYLLVLQDARIFAVDISGPQLRLTDRINVYRNASDDGWYDEMLVEGNRVLITSYSYADEATEIAVFQLDTATGRLSRNGAFLISSEDYYSSDNYATRIVGDRLIIYTPYEADDVTDRSGRPRIRRWLTEAEREALIDGGADEDRDERLAGRAMLRAEEIYRPLIPTVDAYVHSITICDLGEYRADRVPGCRVTAFTGPRQAEMFVTPREVFLWVGAGWAELDRDWYSDQKPCAVGRPDLRTLPPSAVYRVPITATTLGVVGVSGRPFDQFSMDMTDGFFRGLWSLRDMTCDSGEQDVPVAFTNIALREFTESFTPLRAARHIAVPSIRPGQVRNRFADDWLVYGSGDWGYRAIPDEPPADDTPEKAALRAAERAGSVVVLPVDHPSQATVVPVGHNVIRIDRVGLDGMIVNGYRDHQGLTMSLIQLGATPHVAASTTLSGRYESEGRSHAFNSSVGLDGNGLIGVPTIAMPSGRHFWNSDTSDVSFASVTGGATRSLADAGLLTSTTVEREERAPDYVCEVSCTDWYGNSRPIFTGGRIFALMETELVEGRLVDGRMTEVQRIDMIRQVPPGREGEIKR